jgi:GPH family glycoside/pentoside/hexuronide:cation symporter
MSYRTVFIAVGQLLALSGGAALIGLFGGDRGGYAKMGLILGAAAAASMLISFFGTARARQGAPPLKSGRTSPLEAARLVFQNRPFVLLMACKFCNLLALSATTSTQLLFLLNVTRAGYSGQLQLTLGLNIAMAASLPAWTVASRKLGKRNGYIIATVLYIVATLSWLLSRQGEPASALVARGVLTGLSSGGMLLFGGAMLPDTMEHDRRQTGLRRAGMFSSLYAIVEKFAFALGPGLIGLYLAAQHYIPTKHGRLVVQPPSAIEALYMGIAVIPAILSIVGIALLAFYKLDESTLGPEL